MCVTGEKWGLQHVVYGRISDGAVKRYNVSFSVFVVTTTVHTWWYTPHQRKHTCSSTLLARFEENHLRPVHSPHKKANNVGSVLMSWPHHIRHHTRAHTQHELKKYRFVINNWSRYYNVNYRMWIWTHWKVEPMWYFELKQNISGVRLGRLVVNTIRRLDRVLNLPQIINEYNPEVFVDHCKHNFPFCGSMAFNCFCQLACWMVFIYLLMLFRSKKHFTFDAQYVYLFYIGHDWVSLTSVFRFRFPG